MPGRPAPHLGPTGPGRCRPSRPKRSFWPFAFTRGTLRRGPLRTPMLVPCVDGGVLFQRGSEALARAAAHRSGPALLAALQTARATRAALTVSRSACRPARSFSLAPGSHRAGAAPRDRLSTSLPATGVPGVEPVRREAEGSGGKRSEAAGCGRFPGTPGGLEFPRRPVRQPIRSSLIGAVFRASMGPPPVEANRPCDYRTYRFLRSPRSGPGGPDNNVRGGKVLLPGARGV
jgi:hypothetical protein